LHSGAEIRRKSEHWGSGKGWKSKDREQKSEPKKVPEQIVLPGAEQLTLPLPELRPKEAVAVQLQPIGGLP